MKVTYLHTMVRVKDLDASMAFYKLLGLEEIRRHDSEKGRFTLVYLAPPQQPECPVELTYNWDGDDGLPSDSRHFGHLAFEVEDIYAMCQHLMDNGVIINRPPPITAMASPRPLAVVPPRSRAVAKPSAAEIEVEECAAPNGS